MQDWPVTTVVAAAAFLIGLAFGAVAQRTHFCTMGGVADAALFGSFRRLRAWLLAIAVALVTSQILHLAGLVDLGGSIYLGPRVSWLGALLGGLLFGFGMVLAGGCASRNLVRTGAGSLKALVTLLVLGLVAFATLSGLLAPLRLELEALGSVDLAARGVRHQGAGEVLGGLLGGGAAWLTPALAVLIGGCLAWFCLKDEAFRRSTGDVVAGLAIGLLVALGWLATGWLGADDFDPVPLASLTFVAPSGQTLLYLMTWTGASIGFAVATVLGVVAGAFAMAVATGRFRLEGFTGVEDMARNLLGAALMGFGGVLALGCTIGAGITGVATLALGSWLALGAIILGALFALRRLEAGSLAGALRLMAGRRDAARSAGGGANPCAAAAPGRGDPGPRG